MTQVKTRLGYLNDFEAKAVLGFVGDIRKALGDEIIDIKLFGSKVRGDFDSESDIDILIVTKSDDSDTENLIFSTLVDYKIETELYLAPIVYKAKDYEYSKSKGSQFIQNVENEGIRI